MSRWFYAAISVIAKWDGRFNGQLAPETRSAQKARDSLSRDTEDLRDLFLIKQKKINKYSYFSVVACRFESRTNVN